MLHVQEGVAPEHREVEEWGYMPYKDVKRLVEEGKIKDFIAAAHMVHVGEVIRDLGRGILVSEGIDEDLARHIGFIPAEDIEKALNEAFRICGSEAKILVMKKAPYLLPVLKKRG